MKEQMNAWKRQWQGLIQALEQKGADTRFSACPPAAESELAEVESRLGIRLPQELSSLLKEGAGKVYVYWNLPDTAILPFEVSGELGWDADRLDFFVPPGEEDSRETQRYLSFHPAGNGDELLLDLHSASGTAVVHWAHETAEYLLLAPSITEFIDKITALGCVGAEEWQYPEFCGEAGLDPEKPASRQWMAWLNEYITLTLPQAQKKLPLLLRYAEMFGIDPETVGAFGNYNADEVLQAFLERAGQERDSHTKEAILSLAGDVLKEKAAEFVRSLWSETPSLEVGRGTLAYLSAQCLPEDEGLERVFRLLEELASTQKLSGYQANSLLQDFHSRRVLGWMEDKVAFPYGGWDTLYVQSQPTPSDIIQWLGGSDVQRQIVIAAFPVWYDNTGAKFSSAPELLQIRNLLEQALDEAVLKKEKQAVRDALGRLA
ncbi:SMI1/KNR4 family protein [Paenibacillus jilunlii]|uniref:SMI1-KNR4 cell-wall n=1 Tax=Paenibacillus jilunlii TaxID=682956 RepID=A0A1G9FW79_9BACL|nr:SMI1/KNR4 family protein [Paenibacillus jilunlii]SDK92403.1 SMI1-KNR4 cell-wall [Paenibacillus jilunlii]